MCNKFLKRSFVKNTEKILISPGENSQSVRYLKFTNTKQITDLESTIKAYIYEAIEVEKTGLKVKLKDNTKLEYIEELQFIMDNDSAFKAAFEALTPGRQRAYNMFFESAKQSKTRVSRIENYTERILNGKGMNDCVCGHSKRMPNCDGSHKYFN